MSPPINRIFLYYKSTKSYFYHSEVFSFSCCIRGSLFPYKWEVLFLRARSTPVISKSILGIGYSFRECILDGEFGLRFTTPQFKHLWCQLASTKVVAARIISEGTADLISWIHDVESEFNLLFIQQIHRCEETLHGKQRNTLETTRTDSVLLKQLQFCRNEHPKEPLPEWWQNTHIISLYDMYFPEAAWQRIYCSPVAAKNARSD